MKLPKPLAWLDLHMEEAVCVICLVALSCMMMFQIIMRYVFKAALPWAEEFCRYCFIYAAMIGMGYVIRQGRNLRVDILISLLPGKIGKITDLLGELASVAFYALMIYASWATTMKLMQLGQVSPAMQIPMWTVHIAGPIGFSLALLRTLQRIAKLILTFRNEEEKKA